MGEIWNLAMRNYSPLLTSDHAVWIRLESTVKHAINWYLWASLVLRTAVFWPEIAQGSADVLKSSLFITKNIQLQTAFLYTTAVPLEFLPTKIFSASWKYIVVLGKYMVLKASARG